MNAMKDYPEAEQILYALGMKRLIEAKKMANAFRAGSTYLPTNFTVHLSRYYYCLFGRFQRYVDSNIIFQKK